MSDESRAAVRVVAYVRVSMAREDMISPELQLMAITDYCKRRGYEIVRTIEDLDLSGRFWNRRQVEVAIRMIEQDEADVLAVWRWSRVSRNRLDWALAVDRVESVGGRLESATEGFDTTTATGRFARGMMAEFAAYESDRMGDIWREVRERRARMGLTATGREQFGYLKIRGRYVPDRKTGPVLVRVYRRYIAGESFRSLSLWLTKRGYHTAHPHKPGVGWSRQNLISMMDRGFAAGYIIAEGEFMRGAHKALITEDEWQAYRQRRSATSWHKRTTLDPFLLDGLLYCDCGTRMGTMQACTSAKAKYKCHAHSIGVAKTRCINQERVEPLVREWLVRLASDVEVTTQASDAARVFSRARWMDARRLAGQRATAAADDLPDLEAEIERAEADVRVQDPVDIARALCEDWADLTIDSRQAKLRELVTRITLDMTYTTLVLVVSTTWGTHDRFAGITRPVLDPAPRSDLPNIDAPTSTGDPTQLLTTAEAAKLIGVTRNAVNQWRRIGLLPESSQVRDGCYLYSLRDLRRIMAAPACAGGRSRSAVRAEIAQTCPVRLNGEFRARVTSGHGRT